MMKRQLLIWYPWWSLENYKPAQIAAMYQRELYFPQEKAAVKYTKQILNTEDPEVQAEIWDAYVNRYEL